MMFINVAAIILSFLLSYIQLSASLQHETESMINLETNRTYHKQCIKSDIQFGSVNNNEYIEQSLRALRNASGYFSYVTESRIRATYLLSQAALMLPYHGDFVETGLAKGGSAAVMLQVLRDHDACGRKFWGYDSFEGIPEPIAGENEFGSKKRKGTYAHIQENFEGNIRIWNLWNDTRIHITKGWFNDTLPVSKIKDIVFLRLDGDIYASTRDAIHALYDRVVPGGYIYVDDYGSFYGCRRAIDEYRMQHRIYETMHYIREKKNMRYIHFEAIWWKKRT